MYDANSKVKMLRKGTMSPFKQNKTLKEDAKSRFEVERRSFRRMFTSPSFASDKNVTSLSSGKHKNSILKIPKEAKENHSTQKEVFQPEIYLGNKIIQELTYKYKAELLPLPHPKKKERKPDLIDIKATKREEPRYVDKNSRQTNRKAVTFLDEKLKTGFTNTAFVLSPPSLVQNNESDICSGIINEGFVVSPVVQTDKKSEGKTMGERPKPIIRPTEEFLQSLNEEYVLEKDSEDELSGIANKAFIHSPDSVAIDIEEKLMEREKLRNKGIGKKRKGFVNQMKKFSNSKSGSSEKEKENDSKQKRRHRSLLSRKKREEKPSKEFSDGIFNENLNLSLEEAFHQKKGKSLRGSTPLRSARSFSDFTRFPEPHKLSLNLGVQDFWSDVSVEQISFSSRFFHSSFYFSGKEFSEQ